MARSHIDVAQCLRSEALTSKQLQAATGLSQSAVSRQIKLLGDSIVPLPNGRQPKYALTRSAFGQGEKISLYVVDTDGNSTVVAYLRPLSPRGYFIDPLDAASPLLSGCNGTGVFYDLPYYLQGLRPEGFIGRQIARGLTERFSEFSADPRRWHTDHLGRFLVSNGDDLPGNIQLGQAGSLRTERVPIPHSRNDYPDIASTILSGQLTGSFAGGEQPKFTVYSSDRAAHVIVKFSPPGNDPIARRWRDILITEYHASQALHALSIPSAEVELVERGGRLFLEAVRFDRVGQNGRSSMISLQMVDAEFVGDGADWPIVMQQLASQDLLSQQDLQQAQFLWEFGYLINNTDMHLGNLSLAINGPVFKILPTYDMCSMGFAPIGSEVRPRSLHLPQQ